MPWPESGSGAQAHADTQSWGFSVSLNSYEQQNGYPAECNAVRHDSDKTHNRIFDKP